MRLLKILIMVVMVMGFNPIQDGDWQGLNIALEQLFFTNAEAATKVKTKKTGTVSARKTVTIKNDASSEIADGNNIDVKIQGVDDGQGVSLYVDGGSDENVTIPDTGIIYKTQAKIAVPSSYFLDLRGQWVSDTEQRYTADLLVLHDNNGNTLTLTDIDETNNIGTAGPIAGGRDRVGGFNNNSWIYFFIIYNPVTGDISSLSSQASAIAPTLPTGYTFFVRVGSVPTDVWAHLTKTVQIKDRIFHGVIWCAWDSHATGFQNLSALISYYIPPTGKIIHGVMGLSAGTTPRKARVASDSTPVISIGALCDAQGTADEDYGVSGSKTFDLPLTSPQTMYWQTETTDDIYALGITGFTDDL